MGIKTWNKKPLKHLCHRIGDGLHGTPEYAEEGEIYFINGNNLKNGKIEITTDTKKVSSEVLESNYIKLDSNTLLLSINGTLGSMAFYNNENIMLGKSAAYLNFKTGINQFYYYYFQQNNVQNCFYNLATGSTIKNLGLKSIQDFEVPVPEENEWTKIAKVLSDLDAKIELNNKINAELEAMAKLIYDYWFVQFEFPCLPQDYRPSGQVNPNCLPQDYRPSGQVNPNFDLKEKITSFCTYKQTGGLPLPDGRSWFVYVLLCDDGSFYKGMTNDLYRRYYEHGTGQGANHTKVHKPVKVIHWEQFDTQEEAALREKELKTGFGRTWIQREYEKLQKQQEKPGSPAHQNARLSKLMPAGKMVWNEELKREVPEGWENGTIDKIADLVRGVSYSKNDIRTKDDKDVTPILRATNITGSKIDLDDMVYVPSTLVSDNQIINKHDILITMSSGSIDHIGKNGLYYFDEKVAFGAFCAKLIAKRGFSLYLFLYTQSDFVSATIKNECLGTNINNLNGSLVKGFKIVIPDEKFLNLFNQKVEPLYHKIGLNQKENQKLAELRDWLLPMLMNGQVRVGGNYGQEEEVGMAAEASVEYEKF